MSGPNYGPPNDIGEMISRIRASTSVPSDPYGEDRHYGGYSGHRSAGTYSPDPYERARRGRGSQRRRDWYQHDGRSSEYHEEESYDNYDTYDYQDERGRRWRGGDERENEWSRDHGGDGTREWDRGKEWMQEEEEEWEPEWEQERSSRRQWSGQRQRERSRSRERVESGRERYRDRDHTQREQGRRDREQDRGEPSSTVCLRNLIDSVQEDDLYQALREVGCTVMKDVRLVRHRETGQSRGFAFVEFLSQDDAERLIRISDRQGLYVHDRRVSASYSKSRYIDDRVSDWSCPQCQRLNFRWRDVCFSCHSPKPDPNMAMDPPVPENSLDGSRYASNTPQCNVLLFRKLDALSTEDSIREALLAILPIRIMDILVMRDALTNTSRGFCFVEFDSIQTAVYVEQALQSFQPPFLVDNREVKVSYVKWPLTGNSNSCVTAHHPQLGQVLPAQLPGSIGTYVSAAMLISSVANTEQELAKDEAISRSMREKEKAWKTSSESGNSSQLKRGSQSQRKGKGHQKANNPIAENAVSAAAALAANASAQTYNGSQQQQSKHQTQQQQNESASGERSEPSFTYNESTGLYYDPKTTYYYNPVSCRYCYYNAQQQVYIGVDEAGNSMGPETLPIATAALQEPLEMGDRKKKEKESKKKTAKQIARDMERWTKRINDARLILKGSAVDDEPLSSAAISKTGVAGTLGLEHLRAVASSTSVVEADLTPAPAVPSSGTGMIDPDPTHTDWDTLACLLCKRKFASREALIRHQKLSDLHKENLEKEQSQPGVYRDRAQERRNIQGTQWT
ncbi:RNA-binding protein 5-A-like [Corticium candelabrum]|uniref:RNA-binding protein 5-A-like n=1 Tax=Corticium candelabrum TaxID=121492 RepID=UPI002E25C8E1|nr:RNA-binding protein 5-A-like [Corticium candelabrum]